MFRIKEIRESKKYSQEYLAKKANVNRSLLNQLENDKISSTTTDTLSKIAVALDCKITDLFFESGV